MPCGDETVFLSGLIKYYLPFSYQNMPLLQRDLGLRSMKLFCSFIVGDFIW